MKFAPVLKPENSLVAGLAVVGLVTADYALHVGSVGTVHMTDANNDAAEALRKKAGWSAFALVAGVSLLARDPNIFILGSATIIVWEASIRHSLMANPDTGKIELPAPSAYAPAQATGTPDYQQE